MNRRSLLQSGAASGRTTVRNATELYNALQNDVKHINIEDHMDLTDLVEVRSTEQGNTTLPDVSQDVDAIWVRGNPSQS